MKIAITGGTGFIGRNLTFSLAKSGHKLRVLSRNPNPEGPKSSNIVYLCGDLNIKSSLNSFLDDVDILFHCAGEIRDKSKMEELHITGTQNLINLATGKIKRWVQLSSTGVYGFPRSGIITEDSIGAPEGVYEITKVLSDNLVIEAAKRGAFEYSILRPSVVFGSDMPNQSLFALLRMIESGKFFFIGSPGSSANYIHIENVVHALKLCAFVPQAADGIYNISDYLTWEEFVSVIAKKVGVDAPSIRVPEVPIRLLAYLLKIIPKWPLRPSRVDALTTFVRYSDSKIKRELNYTPCVSMDHAITDLVLGYKKYENKKN